MCPSAHLVVTESSPGCRVAAVIHAGHPPCLQEEARRNSKPRHLGQRSLGHWSLGQISINLVPAAAPQTDDTARADLDIGGPAGRAAGDSAAEATGGRSLRRWWSASSSHRKLHRRSQSIPDSLMQLEHGGAGWRAQSESSGPGRRPQSGSQLGLPAAAEQASGQQASSDGALDGQALAAGDSQQPPAASEQVHAAGGKPHHGSLDTMRTDSELVLSVGEGQQRGSLRCMRTASEKALSVASHSGPAAGANNSP